MSSATDAAVAGDYAGMSQGVLQTAGTVTPGKTGEILMKSADDAAVMVDAGIN